ncbi:MAG: hypothetical protein HYW63_01875 [Candidatus Levybacteria bacterium]|nr:hypothetical protein [Candidatus Levybacteria bacterium]
MKNLGSVLLLFLISLLPLVTLFQLGLPITHDGQDHVARIANFYASLSEGNIIPRWANNLNWGYGHPILMFLYPLPSYFASVFHFLGFSLVDSVKAVFGISYILSGLFMFLWLKNFLGKFPSLVGAVIYLYAPYRFVDLYVRGAIGEHTAFIFMPAICYFLLKQSLEKKFNLIYFLGLGFSTAGLILSHNAISLMFFPFVFVYIIYLFWLSKKKLQLTTSIFGIFWGFALPAFFWVPAFFEGKYTLRDIVTKNEALTRFVDPQSLIYGPWNFGGTGVFSAQVGIIPWIFILLLPVCFYFLLKKRTERSNLIFLIIASIFFFSSIFLMLEISKPVWLTITTLQKFQFPWRFLTISVFSSSLIGAYIVYSIRNQKFQKLLFVFVLVTSLILTKDYWRANDFLYKDESYYSGIYNSTTDTGESSPIWSVRFMEKRPEKEIEIIQGYAKIVKLLRSTTSRSYKIESLEAVRIRENTLYFPGWKVYVDGSEEKNIEFQDPNNRGLITFGLAPGKHKVDIIFENTKLRKFADAVSAVSVLGLILLIIVYRVKWQNR